MSAIAPPRRSRLSSADRRPRSYRRIAFRVVAATLGALILAAAAFWFSGGRWFVVQTPSMGTAAPVGTLVLTRPTTVGALEVGDIIAFHPPTQPSETYTHRIVSIKDGAVRTRGDINGIADPWQLHDRDIIGDAAVVPGLGWLFRALPLLVIGGLLVWGLTRAWVSPAWRDPARMLGACVAFAIPVAILTPFVGVAQLASTSDPDGVSHISVVSTGLLPVRLEPRPGHGHAAPVDLHSAGSTGVSNLHGGTGGAQYLLDTQLHFSLLGWVLLVAFCLLPTIWTLLVGYRPVTDAAVPA